MTSPFIVGISGGSGSGKTHLVNALRKIFAPDEMSIVSQDNYYKNKALVPKDALGVENFDTLEAIHFDSFLRDIKSLLAGKAVEIQEYTFNNPGKTPNKIIVQPAPVILIEGIFLFSVGEIADLLDLKIFVEASETIKIKRRIMRDAVERGYDFEDVFYRYENHVNPAYDKYIRPYIELADLIVPNHRNIEKAVEVVSGFLKNKIHIDQSR